ncbi:hypothetical protein [Corallococcus sp. M7]
MMKTGYVVAAAFLSLVGCQGQDEGTKAVGTEQAQAQAACVERFNGIQSCATGGASLEFTDEGLRVTGLSDPKTDGLSSHFGGAVAWRQNATANIGGGQGRFAFAARDGDQVVSTLGIAPDEEGTGVTFTPAFTGTAGGSEFQVRVFQGGVLQGEGTGGPGPAARWHVYTNWMGDVVMVSDFYLREHGPFLPFPFRNAPDAAQEQGACVWRFQFPGRTFTVEVDGAELTGDAIEFTETIGQGAYPYRHFSGIDVKGSADAYTVHGELALNADGQAR